MGQKEGSNGSGTENTASEKGKGTFPGRTGGSVGGVAVGGIQMGKRAKHAGCGKDRGDEPIFCRYYRLSFDGGAGPRTKRRADETDKAPIRADSVFILCGPDGHGADFGYRQLVRGTDGDLRLGRLDASSVRRVGVWHRRAALQSAGPVLGTVCQCMLGSFFAVFRPYNPGSRRHPRALSVWAAELGGVCRAVYGVCGDDIPCNEKAFGRRIEKEEAGCFLFLYADISVAAETP